MGNFHSGLPSLSAHRLTGTSTRLAIAAEMATTGMILVISGTNASSSPMKRWTTGTAASTPMRALWTYQDGQVVSDDSQTLVPTGADTTEFHISKPDGFPAGSYKVEIFVDGKSVATRSFTVK